MLHLFLAEACCTLHWWLNYFDSLSLTIDRKLKFYHCLQYACEQHFGILICINIPGQQKLERLEVQKTHFQVEIIQIRSIVGMRKVYPISRYRKKLDCKPACQQRHFNPQSELNSLRWKEFEVKCWKLSIRQNIQYNTGGTGWLVIKKGIIQTQSDEEKYGIIFPDRPRREKKFLIRMIHRIYC